MGAASIIHDDEGRALLSLNFAFLLLPFVEAHLQTVAEVARVP
jgi:hypothetical protein